MKQMPGYSRPGSRANHGALTALAAVLLITVATHASLFANDFRGVQFFGFTTFSNFSASVGYQPAECILISPEIQTAICWDELIPSWNISAGSFAGMKIEARPISALLQAPFYTLGLWSTETNRHPRRSIDNQNDSYASVQTDTLMLKKPSHGFQLRLTVSGTTN